MDSQQIFFLGLVFCVVFGLVLLGVLMLSDNPLRRRLAGLIGVGPTPVEPEAGGGWVVKIARVVQPFAKLSLPKEGWENSPLRSRFMHAGWRNPASPALYLAGKTVLALGLPLLAGVLVAQSGATVERANFLFVLLLCASCGYYLPNIVLRRTLEQRQREIFETFPDALDLLTVCVEAGLSLDSALAKVAGEIHVKSLVLARELQLVLMEMRAGLSKEKALRNLALRTGVEDIDTLVAMLIQSERFGTSMGDSLRVHSDNLRTKRRLRAEEAAAKIGLKLLFPLIFFIFPTLFLVLLGPAMVQIYRILIPTLNVAQ